MSEPFKLILTLSKDKQGEVYSGNSLTWTPDDKLLVCSSEKILIVNVVLNQSSRLSPGEDIFTTFTELTLSILDVPDFSLLDGVLNYERSFPFLEDVNRHQLMADPLLSESGFLQFSNSKVLKNAVCSSFFNGNRESYLIACVTYGARLIIFAAEGHHFKPYECSQFVKEKMTTEMTLPITVKNQKHFDEYVELIHSMATVEIVWSQLFVHENCDSFFLLVTGSRNGDVHLWKVDTDFKNEQKQLVWQFTDKYQSEVMSLAWLSRGQCRGLLAVGYVNGSLRVLDVAVAWDPVLSITVREIMSDLHCDDLSVAGLDFGVTSQGTEILVACKQCFLFLYTLSDLGSTVKFYKHFEMDVALPLTSVHLRGMFGVASPKESAVVAFEVQESSEISIVQTRQDFTTLSEKVSAPYFSCGATLSPSSALCFSVHKTGFNLQPYRKRHKVLEGQVVAMNIPFSLSPEKMLITLQNPQVTNKDTILNLCLYMKQLLAESKEIETSALDQICHMLKSLMETLGRRGFQVSLALMKFLKLLIQSKSESDWCPEWLPRAYEETLKVSLSEYASETMESSGTLSALSETDQRIISSIERHWNGEVSTPGMLDKDTVVPSSLCLICGSEFLPDTPLTVKCTKGHKANLCCLSCQPCQDLNVRRCETCGASALSLEALSGSMVLQNKSVCPICGSQLVESTWT